MEVIQILPAAKEIHDSFINTMVSFNSYCVFELRHCICDSKVLGIKNCYSVSDSVAKNCYQFFLNCHCNRTNYYTHDAKHCSYGFDSVVEYCYCVSDYVARIVFLTLLLHTDTVILIQLLKTGTIHNTTSATQDTCVFDSVANSNNCYTTQVWNIV